MAVPSAKKIVRGLIAYSLYVTGVITMNSHSTKFPFPQVLTRLNLCIVSRPISVEAISKTNLFLLTTQNVDCDCLSQTDSLPLEKTEIKYILYCYFWYSSQIILRIVLYGSTPQPGPTVIGTVSPPQPFLLIQKRASRSTPQLIEQIVLKQELDFYYLAKLVSLHPISVD